MTTAVWKHLADLPLQGAAPALTRVTRTVHARAKCEGLTAFQQLPALRCLSVAPTVPQNSAFGTHDYRGVEHLADLPLHAPLLRRARRTVCSVALKTLAPALRATLQYAHLEGN